MRRLQLLSVALLALAGCSGGGDGDGGNVTPPPTPTIGIQLSSASATVNQGASTTTTVTLTRGGNYTGTVNLTATAPSGVSVAFNPAALASGSTASTATITVGSTTTTGGAVVITASGSGVTSATSTFTLSVAQPAITVSAGSPTLSVVQGASGTIPLTITRTGGYTGAVTVAATGLPAGVTAAPVTIASGSTTGTMTVAVGATAAVTATAVPITLTASGTGVSNQTATVNLSITAAATPAFSLTASNASTSITVGQTVTSTITVTRTGGFTGAVALTASGAPSGMTATFNPASVASGATTSTLTIATTASVTPGTYNLTVTGSGPGVSNQTTGITVTVSAAPGISIATSAASVSGAAGGTATTGVTLTRVGGYTGDVTLAVTGLPSGATAVFAPATLTGATLASTLTLTLGSSVAPATYPLVINAAGPVTGGTTNATVNLSLTVTAAQSYTLSASAASLQQGGTGTSTVTITRSGGFAGTVNLAVSGLPSGVTASFNPQAATGNSSTLTFTATSGATTGAFTATITGTATGLANVTTTVAGTVTASGGGSGNVTVRFCDPSQYPLWVAYRSGTSGAWTRATAGSNQTYSFSISGAGGMAWAQPSGSNGYAVTVHYGSAAELTTYGTAQCTNNSGNGKSLSGSFAGLNGPLQSGQVSVGGAFAQSNVGATTFNLTNVADGSTDLLAYRVNTVLNGSSVTLAPDKGIIRRGVNYANGSTIPVLDFNASEAFTPASAQVTVTNPSGGILTVIAGFQTGNGTIGGFAFGDLLGSGSSTSTVYGLPTSLTQPGDFHLVQATSTVTVNNLPVSSRSVTQFNRNLANRTLTLGPQLAISGSGLVTIATSPYARLRVNGTWQSDYGDYMLGTFSQTASGVTRSWVVSATRAYFNNASTFEIEMPDFASVAGFDVNWGLRPGFQVSFGALAYSAGTATTTIEDMTVKTAAVYGTHTP